MTQTVTAFRTRARLPHQLRKGDTLATSDGQVRTAGPRGAYVARVDHVQFVPDNGRQAAHYNIFIDGLEAPMYWPRSEEVLILAGVRCGNCSTKDRPVLHPTTADVRDCFQQRYDQDFQIEAEQEAERLATRYWEEGF